MWPFWTEKYRTYTPQAVHGQTFDYIVVGGGTGGCVVASRLSEDPNVRVLLIERGPIVDTWLSRVPLLSVDFRASSSPTYKWNSASDDLYPAGEHLVAGKVFGGTSKINAHVYTRGVPADYNAWAEAGRKGWDWKTVEPYFRRSETSLTHQREEYRGSLGPWHNRKLPELHFKFSDIYLNAAHSLGIPRVQDIHDPSITPYSAACLDVTVDGSGNRVSTFDSFLPMKLVNARQNLYICPCTVTRRLNTQSTPNGIKVTGVYIMPELDSATKEEYYVEVKHEVIMCAGAIATPQILMLSGIGPAEHLKTFNIPVINNLPGIGSNLQDHACVPLSYKVPKPDTLHILESSRLLAAWEVLKYVLFGRGLLLSPNPQIATFAVSHLLKDDSHTDQRSSGTDSHSPSNIPDIEIAPVPFNAFDQDTKIDDASGVTTVCCMNLKPKSTGSIRLLSLDPRDGPACELGYLTHNDDFTVFRKMMRLALELGRKSREQGYPLRDLRVPASEDDEELDRYVRRSIRTTFHYSCTCKMAPEAEEGVVDDELRVHGIQGLRIADASIFPVIPSAHPQAPVVMVAERCADFIKAERVNSLTTCTNIGGVVVCLDIV